MLLPSRKMLHVAVAAAGIGVLLMSAAQAFTFENPGAPAGNPSELRFGTGDSRFSTGTGNSTTNAPPSRPGGFRFGNGVQFNGQSSFDQRYNADRMFDSNGILSKDR